MIERTRRGEAPSRRCPRVAATIRTYGDYNAPLEHKPKRRSAVLRLDVLDHLTLERVDLQGRSGFRQPRKGSTACECEVIVTFLVRIKQARCVVAMEKAGAVQGERKNGKFAPGRHSHP